MSQAEQVEASEAVDDITSSRAHAPQFVVGLGASAGGLAALEEFFQELPPEPGMAFVVITHLAHGSTSMLPEIIARYSRMPIVKQLDGVELEADRVYVQPPGVTLGLLNGKLHVFEPPEDGPRPLPIDFFFRCLAQDTRERSVGIVLSGTGTDGTNGLKEIKAAFGLTMAQDEATARYPGMPHSASTALELDYVLPPREMAQKLLAYAKAPNGAAGFRGEPGIDSAEVMSRIFVLMRDRTGHDFSQYKATTTARRIARRMHVHQLETSKEYLRYVQINPPELDLLFRELLIGVTSFFRDADAFQALSEVALQKLLEGKAEGYVVRCWVAGCSTGEEAYSLAMLLREHMDAASTRFAAQVFATDLDPQSVDIARAGVYPAAISSDVSPRRLDRFFVEEDGHYRIKKEIREMVVFATQDLVEDPPFTKLDVLTCRNLLIYLNAEVQKRLIPLFHYALRPGGILFLGSSETVGNGTLFEPLDKKWKVFRRKEVPAGTYVPEVPAPLAGDLGRDVPPLALGRRGDGGLAQLAERAILQHLVPPSVVMQRNGEIVHIQGRTGLFLEPSPGSQANANIYNMVREGLQVELTLAVRQAAGTKDEVVRRGVQVKTNGDFTGVDLRVRQLASPEALRGLFLVSFEMAEATRAPSDADGAPVVTGAGSERVRDLERELLQTKEVHQATVEELETANEELKAANEELQSMNEELQSANEELETSKEEMQSLNEELQTVNAELQGKVEELSRINDDMKNLLNATEIATIFLDNRLNIKRYTEQAKRVIRLIPSDVSRPIGDLVSNLRYTTLMEDAREVLRTLVFKEAEVQGEDGSWYLMRILPYRTMDNMIDGLVVTFVNVTKVGGLQEQTRRLLGALSSSPTGVCGQDRELRYEWSFGSIFGRWPNEIKGRTDGELLSDTEANELTKMKRKVLETGKLTRERFRVSPLGQAKLYDLFLEPVTNAEGQVVGVTSVITALAGEDPN